LTHDLRWIGIDGARGGWAVAGVDTAGEVSLTLVPRIAEVLNWARRAERVLIDMPIGLPPDDRPRRCDQLARQHLKSRASSVFSPPCRAALEAANHSDASAANHAVTGRGLSLQAFHLHPKIREVDSWLRSKPEIQQRVHEAHPEVVFSQLALRTSQTLPLPPKRRPEGGAARRGILEVLMPAALDTLASIAVPRRQAAPDDWLDALGLAVALHVSQGEVEFWPNASERDECGLKMALAVPCVSPAK